MHVPWRVRSDGPAATVRRRPRLRPQAQSKAAPRTSNRSPLSLHRRLKGIHRSLRSCRLDPPPRSPESTVNPNPLIANSGQGGRTDLSEHASVRWEPRKPTESRRCCCTLLLYFAAGGCAPGRAIRVRTRSSRRSEEPGSVASPRYQKPAESNWEKAIATRVSRSWRHQSRTYDLEAKESKIFLRRSMPSCLTSGGINPTTNAASPNRSPITAAWDEP